MIYLTRSTKGSALVIVLAISSILLLGCMFLVSVAKQSIYAARSLMDKLDVQIRADSVVEEFKFVGATGVLYVNKLVNDLAADLKMVREIPLDGSIVDSGSGVRLKALDAGAKLNVWGLNPSYIAQMLMAGGVDEAAARTVKDSLLDWYDQDDLKHLNGAESYYYQVERAEGYGPRNNAAPQCVDELSLVKGLNDPEKWALIKDKLILAPGAVPNYNTMGKAMLCAVFNITPETADHLITLRESRGYLNAVDIMAVTGRQLDDDSVESYPTGVVELTVEATSGTAVEYRHCLISFRPNPTSPYRVLEYTY